MPQNCRPGAERTSSEKARQRKPNSLQLLPSSIVYRGCVPPTDVPREARHTAAGSIRNTMKRPRPHKLSRVCGDTLVCDFMILYRQNLFSTMIDSKKATMNDVLYCTVQYSSTGDGAVLQVMRWTRAASLLSP
ncbi:unnamed protein product, partial [Ectocarpus sp. 8 AP-2014]